MSGYRAAMDARLRNIMRVIDHYGMAAASVADQEARALLTSDPTKRDGHRAAAKVNAEKAATIRIGLEQIVAALLRP